MRQKQGYSRLKKLFNFFRSIANQLNPRYQLSLDHFEHDITQKKNVYFFKSYGDHSFLKLTFQQIKTNDSLMYVINPHDLTKICFDEFLLEQKYNEFRVSEILRNNQFVLADQRNYQIFSGEEICENVLLMEKINKIDLYKIAFNTGFSHGRKIGKMAEEKRKEKNNADNVVTLFLTNG